MDYFKDKNKRNGIIITVLVHLLLIIIFLFTGLTVPVPLPEQGILINFGTVDEGFGDVQPEEVTATEAVETFEENITEQSTPETTESVEEVITQQAEEAPAVNDNPTDNIENEIAEEKEPEPVVDPAALYTGKKSRTKPDSEGETKKYGDQGNIDGTSDSKNYNGSGGKRTGYNLTGRKIVFRPKIQENTQETGKVIVNIWVDRYGKVTRANPGAKGSTTTNAYLYRKAREAAMKAKFSANPDAPEEQKGTIIFNFTVGG